ncbi:hypothetical protein GCM10022245_73330 [Streptomyces mayteni]
MLLGLAAWAAYAFFFQESAAEELRDDGYFLAGEVDDVDVWLTRTATEGEDGVAWRFRPEESCGRGGGPLIDPSEEADQEYFELCGRAQGEGLMILVPPDTGSVTATFEGFDTDPLPLTLLDTPDDWPARVAFGMPYPELRGFDGALEIAYEVRPGR